MLPRKRINFKQFIIKICRHNNLHISFSGVAQFGKSSSFIRRRFVSSSLTTGTIYSIRLAGQWRLPYKQKQPWFESKIEYYPS